MHEQLEIKFRLHDGSDIGPKMYSATTSVATLKESLLAEWPKEKENVPKTVNDVKLINGGKILENNKTLEECKSPLCAFSEGVTTMHVIIRPPSEKRTGTEKKMANAQKGHRCGCVIM